MQLRRHRPNLADHPFQAVAPLAADELIKSGEAAFKVIPTGSKWFGVTYKEDKPIVQKSISELVANGTYPEKLWD